ncbi:MAG TPA: glycosyltransferase [Stellaceae bacterium]|nr:glycosyltransferase [Stellaceae bacterium]
MPRSRPAALAAVQPAPPFATPAESIPAETASVERAVVIAVVVPVFRHSVFVADAVTSACEQEGAPEHRVVIVDDGCPHPETRRVATVLATAYPQRVVYIRRTNGGLSAARNTGVDYALRRWPSLQAIYFLDADNLIEPCTLARAYAALRDGDPQVGWAFPDVAMFGSSEDFCDHSGPYSVLRHLIENVSEAGSLVRREVFDRGCRYDEAMRLGYEDWEFWWQCIDAGFIGRHVPHFGLRYRRRPESMLSESKREHDAVRSYMRRKHKALLRPKQLLALEAGEAPRYGLLLDGEVFRLCTDPRRGCAVGVGEMVGRYIANHQDGYFHAAPRFIVAASASVMQSLAQLRLDRFALWWLHRRVSGKSKVSFAAIELAVSPECHGIAFRAMPADYWPVSFDRLHMLIGDPEALQAALEDESTDWINTLALKKPNPGTAVLRIEVAAALLDMLQHPSAIFHYLNFFHRLRAEYREIPARFPKPKARYLPAGSEVANAPQTLLRCAPLFPAGLEDGYDLAIALPVVSFGGVEKIAHNIARRFRAAGWRCHLLALTTTAELDRSWLADFDSIAFFYDEKLYQWADSSTYLGSAYPGWMNSSDAGPIEGFLSPMDALINFHSAALHGSVAKLRQLGVATSVALQLNDVSALHRENGHPCLAAGYEHAYDLFLPGSDQLLDWCHAIGIPADKLVPVPNAPGYEVPDDEAAAVLRRRALRLGDSVSGSAVGPARQLRVLFIGRFDRQKGLDRLAATIVRCRDVGLPIEWRIVGGSVIDADGALSDAVPRELAEPAIRDAAGLTAAYEWADVLLLPSHWEGLPLTLFEAARLGVVAVAARVGAVEEAVAHGATGLVIDDLPCDDFAAAATEALRRLCEEPGLLRRLSQEAARTMTRNWDASCRDLIARLTAIVQANRKPSGAAASR